MTALMDHRKCRRIHAGFVMGGDAHIPVMQVCGKRVGADCQDSLGKVKTHILCQILSQFPLLLLGIVPVQEIILNTDGAFHHLL